MLCGRAGGGSAGPAQPEESTGGGCCSGGWTGDRSDSHAPDHRCFCREPVALCEGVGRTGSVIHTDGWAGYLPLRNDGYKHDVTILKGKKKTPSELMPRVHLVISLLKRWLMGTHQGAVSHKHLDYYLDEFTFRFNTRRSKSRGKLFYRLAHQELLVEPVPLAQILHPGAKTNQKPQSIGVW